MSEIGRIEANVSNLSDDLLSFEKDINGFKKLITTVNPKFVLTVEAPWGSGKSTFLRILRSELESTDSVITINAWENDYANNPIATILSGILDSDLSRENHELTEDILKIGIKYTKTLLPIVIKMLTAGILDTKGMENFSLDEFMEATTSTMVEEFKSQKDDLTQLKSKLGDLVDKAENKKIFFLIDELDRCRPNYALEFLEAVKHLFNVQGIVFILAIEDRVIANQMRQVYGQEFDSNEYLKKFIDIRYKLSPRITFKFVESRFEEYGLNTLLGKNIPFSPQIESNLYVKLIYIMAHLYKLSPRDLNQVITKYLLILVKVERDKISPFAVLFILLLQQKSNNLANKYIEEQSLKNIYNANSSNDWVLLTNVFEFCSADFNLGDGDAIDMVSYLLIYKARGLEVQFANLKSIFSYDHDKDNGTNLSRLQEMEKWVIRTFYDISLNSFPQDILEKSSKAVFHTELE